MIQLNSTRVKAPNNHPVTASSVYDGATPKPPGRVGPDSCSKTGANTHFIRRKNMFQLSTLNTRTLNPLSRKHELATSAFMHHNDIICIQEHRQHHSLTQIPLELKPSTHISSLLPLLLKTPSMQPSVVLAFYFLPGSKSLSYL